MVRVYRAALPRRPGAPAALIQTRMTRVAAGRSGGSEVSAVTAPPCTAPTTTQQASMPALAPQPLPSKSATVSIKPCRRISPISRPKSPVKVVRQPDVSPKRPIVNDNINIERLKMARDEAERAMKV